MNTRFLRVDRRLNEKTYPFSFLFYRPKFLSKNCDDPLISFHLEKETKPIALAEFSLKKKEAISIAQAPFGGIDFRRYIEQEDFIFFLKSVESELYARGVRQIELRLPPVIYRPSKVALESRWLQELGYEIIGSEINCHLEVDLATPFYSLLQSSEKNKRNKAAKAGCVCTELENNAFDSVFDLVEKNRAHKGYPVTMTREKLSLLVNSFSEYRLFGAFLGEKLIAAVVAIEINQKVLYNFYMADDPDYRSLSPLVLLNEFIYNKCKYEKRPILDLGTVTDNGVLNKGLLDFKKHLGAKTSTKFRFKKSIVL